MVHHTIDSINKINFKIINKLKKQRKDEIFKDNEADIQINVDRLATKKEIIISRTIKQFHSTNAILDYKG